MNKLSDTEYFDALQKCYEDANGGSPCPYDPSERESDLLIDYKLGVDIHPEKQKLLKHAQSAARDCLTKHNRNFLRRKFRPKSHAKAINELNHRLMVVFYTILTQEEFKQYTGLSSPDDVVELVDYRKISNY